MSQSFPLVPLENIFTIARGGSPRPIDKFITEDPDGINWVLISDATESGKYINSTKKRIREEGAKRSRAVKPGDFLLTNSMSFGRPYIMNTSGCIHDGWLVLSPRDSKVLSDFFYHLLGSELVYAEFKRLASGATVKNLNIDLVKGVRVPLPPLPEQRRIAEILDRAEALRAKRRAALAQLDTLTQSIFLDLFGDPVTNGKQWEVRKLSEISHFENGDRSSNYPSGGDIKDEGVLFLSTKNVVDDRLDLSAAVFITEEKFKSLSRGKAKRNDLIITLRGTLGTCCIFDCEYETAFINAQMMIIRPIQEGTHRYLYALLTSRQAKDRFARIGYGAAVRQLSASQLSELPIPVPPPDLQHEFERRINVVEKLKAAHRASLAELDALFAVLQHRAFRGEL